MPISDRPGARDPAAILQFTQSLAMKMLGTVEIDQEIPQEHYRAVAEIIGYLMRLRRLVAG